MHQSIKLLIALFISVKVFATEARPPIIFSKAEFINETTTRIPFKVIDHLIVVEAQLLNQEGNFIIDTGSKTLILNSQHFKTHYGSIKSQEEINGVNGTIETVNEKYISALSIKALQLNKLNADVIDLSHFEKVKKINLLGIIGYSILKDFEVFIDMHLNQITLTKTDKHGERLSKKVYAEKFQDSIDFKLKKHTIVLTGFVGGHEVKFGLDTGAEYNQINKKLNKKVLDYFYSNQTLKLTGASGKSKRVIAGNLYRFKLNDNIYFGPMKTVLTNLRHMYGVFGTNLDGILGYEFFRQKRTIINYKKRKLYFIKNPLITH
ncbi:pepsin/retropepsin-like aspartic protease family protein [uncultured Winogradskyella sp.]|uniref:pepsin/retropepsin-like aspartic protease family protein n=1 Tax=uncultured Winogradskyella sp. TaxID=395353 RepID=UPI002620DC7C|nr:pepsin/retropepsin-like aspartic protease family protein [uncultured Winogradskyella sp.]